MTTYAQDSSDYLITQIAVLKTTLQSAFASHPYERVVSFPGGPPSWDCEMIALWIQQLRHKSLGVASNPNPINTAVTNVMQVGIDFLRCVTAVSNEGVPKADVVNAEGEQQLVDQWIAWRTITRGLVDGTLFSRCSTKHLQPMQPFPPQGGYGGFRLVVEVTI